MQAGSERVKDTKAEKGMLKEASSINKSLFTLGKVIDTVTVPKLWWEVWQQQSDVLQWVASQWKAGSDCAFSQ